MDFTVEYLGSEYRVIGSVDKTDPESHEFNILDVEGYDGCSVGATDIGQLVEIETDDVFQALSHPHAIQYNGKPHMFVSLEEKIHQVWSDHV